MICGMISYMSNVEVILKFVIFCRFKVEIGIVFREIEREKKEVGRLFGFLVVFVYGLLECVCCVGGWDIVCIKNMFF